MSISSSMNASVAGLSSNANKLATISDNIANASTNGYKRAQMEFHSLVIGESTSKYTAGGVRSTVSRAINERGPLVASSNATDLAIAGRGMLPVTTITGVNSGAMPFQMTTTGAFSPNAEGYLVSASGQVLLGWPADSSGVVPAQSRDTVVGLEPVRILTNQVVGAPTTKITVAANLPATETEAGAEGIVQTQVVEYFDNLGKTQSIDITYTPKVLSTGTSNIWTIEFRDQAQGGLLVGSYEMEFADDRLNGGRLANVVSLSGGGAYDPDTGQVRVNVASGPMDIAIGRYGQADGMTQISDLFAPAAVQRNGASAGTLTGLSVDAGGNIFGSYSNGNTRILYKIPVVDVPNMNGLRSLGAQTYTVSQASGGYYLWDAGTGPTGEMVGNAVEGSAVDIASELTAMIQTQRAYSSNAKVVQTVDEMLQETTNLKR